MGLRGKAPSWGLRPHTPKRLIFDWEGSNYARSESKSGKVFEVVEDEKTLFNNSGNNLLERIANRMTSLIWITQSCNI